MKRFADYLKINSELYFALAVLLLSLIPLAIPYATSGYQIAHDRQVPFMRVAELRRSLEAGNIPPHWFPNFDGGYGSPYPSFYAMAFYYGAVFFSMFTTIGTSVEIMAWLSFVLAAISMFFLANHLWGPASGLLAAVLYTYAPYHLVDGYVRGAYSELSVFIWFPLIALAFLRIIETKSARWMIVGSLATAGLLLSHNIMTMIFIPGFIAVVFAILFQQPSQTDRNTHGAIVWSFGAGILLAGFLWGPVLFERHLINTSYFLQFDFHGDFVPFRDIFMTTRDHDLLTEIGIPLVTSSLIGSIWALKEWFRNKELRLPIFLVAIGFGYIFLTNRRSAFLWEHIPLLEFTQFPWRMLAPASFFLAWAGGSTVMLVKQPRRRLGVSIVLLPLVLWLYLPLIQIPTQVATTEHKVAYTCQEVWGTQDYRPKWSNAPFWAGPTSPTNQAGINALKPCPETAWLHNEGEIEKQSRTRSRNQWLLEVKSARGSMLIIPQFYYPGWRASIDNEQADLHAQTGNGLLALWVPAGGHQIKIWYEATQWQRIGTACSLVGITLLIITSLFWSRREVEAG